MADDTIEISLQKELPNLWYIALINKDAWLKGEFVSGEEWSWFETFSEDIKDSSIPCEEKKKALSLLWKNIKDLLNEGYEPITSDETKPSSHWWWHPELWNKDIDIYEVLKDVCPENKPSK